ncbi:uncharacterized protein [Halyomorpha halys]|uniref:uncharacterized protein n=1 Tax=Halyomorpha halys TaxID=286706 RepID=UPI0006D518DC|nr:uncharacterized protein LOC106685602 [Halyomorpha halys]
MEFLIALIYLSLNIKSSNYHPCLEADVNVKEICPNYQGAHFYYEKKNRNHKYRHTDIHESEDFPWESFNMLTIPWNPFLRDVERKIGNKYPDVWVSLPRIMDHPSRDDIPIVHPFMPRDYYKKEKKIRKETTKEAEIKHLPVLVSITFAILAKFCSILTLHRRNRYAGKEECEMKNLVLDV